RFLGRPPDHGRVVDRDPGGGFGQKMCVQPEELAVAALARTMGRPVKWIETRRENLAAAPQAREAGAEGEARGGATPPPPPRGGGARWPRTSRRWPRTAAWA